ncbi:hypothetical protein Y032_0020g16 [Ancylostoma ceylanicum]|uniref:Uncharacterized protein n=1 Tax=Ancylostoma ceylanicum TaxID=53326 RepID=A0A016V0K8_9BILA|nr:hypothetical protein Y032_0020g16 [Ancylostoma ceylanicum]
MEVPWLKPERILFTACLDRLDQEGGGGQTHASIYERFPMKAARGNMKFSVKRTRGCRRVSMSCDCDATGPYSSSYRRTPRQSHAFSINCPIPGVAT